MQRSIRGQWNELLIHSEARTNTDIDHTGQVSLGFWDLKLTYLLVRWFYWSVASSSLWWEGLLSWKLLFAVHLNAPLRMFHIVREGGWYWLLEWDTWASYQTASQFSLWKRFTHICSQHANSYFSLTLARVGVVKWDGREDWIGKSQVTAG